MDIKFKQSLLRAFIKLSLPKAFNGLKDINDHCLLKAAELKTSSPISVFYMCPCGQSGFVVSRRARFDICRKRTVVMHANCQ